MWKIARNKFMSFDPQLAIIQAARRYIVKAIYKQDGDKESELAYVDDLVRAKELVDGFKKWPAVKPDSVHYEDRRGKVMEQA